LLKKSIFDDVYAEADNNCLDIFAKKKVLYVNIKPGVDTSTFKIRFYSNYFSTGFSVMILLGLIAFIMIVLFSFI